jgi:hypothetical protein
MNEETNYSGIFRKEPCRLFLQFMKEYFRLKLEDICKVCSSKFNLHNPIFNVVYYECVKCIQGWCLQTIAQEVKKLTNVVYIEHLYEYTYYQAFNEFVRSKYCKVRLNVPPSEIHMVHFSKFFELLCKQLCADSRIQNYEKFINMNSIEFGSVVLESIRFVLCECMHNVSCTDEILQPYLNPVNQLLTKDDLQQHTKMAREYILKERDRNVKQFVKSEKSVKSVKSEKSVRSVRSIKSEKSIKSIKSEKSIKSIKSENGKKNEKNEKDEKSEKNENIIKIEIEEKNKNKSPKIILLK